MKPKLESPQLLSFLQFKEKYLYTLMEMFLQQK